jgi:hypothetical protein
VWAWADGDGYLSVDTERWLADRADYNDALTESLCQSLARRPQDGASGEIRGYHHPHTDRVMAWAREVFRLDADTSEPDGWMATFNEGDQLLSEEIGACWIDTGDGLIFVEQSYGAYGAYISPRVHRVHADSDCLADYRACDAVCLHDHRYRVEEGGIWLTACSSDDPPGASAKLAAQVRVPSGDRDRGYVACPGCGEALRFAMPTW